LPAMRGQFRRKTGRRRENLKWKVES